MMPSCRCRDAGLIILMFHDKADDCFSATPPMLMIFHDADTFFVCRADILHGRPFAAVLFRRFPPILTCHFAMPARLMHYAALFYFFFITRFFFTSVACRYFAAYCCELLFTPPAITHYFDATPFSPCAIAYADCCYAMLDAAAMLLFFSFCRYFRAYLCLIADTPLLVSSAADILPFSRCCFLAISPCRCCRHFFRLARRQLMAFRCAML